MPDPTMVLLGNLGKVTQFLTTWWKEVSQRVQDERQKRAARLLKNASYLVWALRALDNGWRDVVNQLSFFDPGWTAQQRQVILAQISAFAVREEYLPIIRQNIEQLERACTVDYMRAADLPENTTEPIEELVKCGRGFLAPVDPQAQPEHELEEIVNRINIRALKLGAQGYWQLGSHLLFTKIQNASTAQDAETVKQDLTLILRSLDRRFLAMADLAFAQLKHEVTNRYPLITDPSLEGPFKHSS